MTYEYVCTACGHAWEAEQSISEAPLKDCPHCGQLCAKRQVSGGQGFILKGGGWYADGYGSKGQSSKDSESRTESKGESKGEPKNDTKPEPKKDSKPEPKKDGSTEPKPDSPKNDSKKEQAQPSAPKSDGGSGTGSKAEGSANAPA